MTRFFHETSAVLCLLLAFGLCAKAWADSSLDTWRSEAAATRTLAENDASAAYQEALRLQTTLPATATPADRARVLNLLARIEIYTAQIESSANHAQQALELANQNNDRVGQAEAYLSITLSSVYQSRIDVLIDAAPRALEVIEGVDRPDLLGEAMLRLAMMYRRMGQIDESVTLCMQAMEIAKDTNNPLALIYAYQGLGVSYDQSGHYIESRTYYSKMRDLARLIPAKQLEAEAVSGLATSFNATNNPSDLREAESINREAITLYQAAGSLFNYAHGLFVLADNLRKQGRLEDTLPILGEAITLYERYPNKIGLWWSLDARSENLLAMGRIADARSDIERAYALAQDLGLLVYRSVSAQRMAAFSAITGDYKRAYQLSAEAADLEAKSVREKSSSRMLELAQRYKSEHKQQQIDRLTLQEQHRAFQQHWLWTVLVGSIVLLAVTTYFLLRLRRSHRLLEASNTQLRQSKDEIRALNVGLEQRIQAHTDELRQQTRYLRTLVDTLPVSVWLKDTESRYLTINTSNINNAVSNGHSIEHIIGKTDLELWPGEIGQAFRATDFEVMLTRQNKTFEVAIPGQDGTIFWREIDKAPVIDEDGTVLGIVGVSRDISERKRYEQALLERAELEQRQSQYFGTAPGLFATMIQRPDGGYAMPFASSGIRDLYGLEPDDVATDIGPLAAVGHPEDIEMMFQKTAESAHNLSPYHVEYRIIHPQKGLRWIEVRALPQRTADGGTRWDGFYHDITERKRMETELARSRNFLNDVIDTIADPIFVKDRLHRWILLNQACCKLIGGSREELLGKSDFDYFGEHEASAFWATDEEAFESGQENIYEESITDGEGVKRTLITRKSCFMDNTGQIVLVGVGRDISERKAAEAAREAALTEAVRLAKLRSEFIAYMSHELRTPLNGILGYAQIMQRDLTLSERNTAALDVIRQSGEHLLALVEDILDLARIETGRLELIMSDIPLNKFLSIVTEIISIKASQKGLEFICELTDDLPEGIHGDEKRLRQVLLNLLANAVKFTNRGRVVLRVSRVTSSRLCFVIQDTGIGIEAAELETIFRHFEQSGDVQHRGGGTGLGLAISRQLVRLMGSDIEVESRIGEGSTFRFELELPAVEAVSTALLPVQVATGYAGPRRKVLIVDSVAKNRAATVNRLAPLGFDMIEACDGREALELAQSTLPDLILMDNVLSGMDGRETILRLRQLTIHVPIIVMYANISDDAEEYLKADANTFIAKRIEQHSLPARIAVLLNLEWIFTQPQEDSAVPDEAVEPLAFPPTEEMQTLHRLAQLGNMRDILRYAERIAALDPRYALFATQLRRLAEGYQSKAILAFVEQHLNNTSTYEFPN